MLYFSSQLSIQKYKPAADRMFAALDLFNIKYKLLNNTKDIWLRDFMPVKTKSGKYVSFRYEPSYLDGSPELRTDFRRDIVPNFDFKKLRFLYKGIIIKHNKTEPTYTKTSLFLCEKRRFLWPGLRKEGNLFKLAGPGGLAFFISRKRRLANGR